MGFHVRLDEQSEELVRLVQSDPSTVFGRLYSAYMLFLIGERDENELKWLLDNAKALDSLTGRHVAYAVFAKEFKVRLRTHSLATDRSPTVVGRIGIGDLQSTHDVTRLVKDGRFGMVVDGDEITAITYGTDLVARELGLIDRLPCVVIVDAVPAKSLCVVKLDREVTASLMILLRKSIAKFQASEGDTTIRRDAELLLEVQRSIAAENVRDATLRTEVSRATQTIDKLKSKLKSGRSTADASYLEQILEKREKELAERVAELAALPQTSSKRLVELEDQLQAATLEHSRHQDLLFSRILVRQVRALGLQSKLGAAKESTLSYVGSLLKPEFLLKVWGLVSP